MFTALGIVSWAIMLYKARGDRGFSELDCSFGLGPWLADCLKHGEMDKLVGDEEVKRMMFEGDESRLWWYSRTMVPTMKVILMFEATVIIQTSPSPVSFQQCLILSAFGHPRCTLFSNYCTAQAMLLLCNVIHFSLQCFYRIIWFTRTCNFVYFIHTAALDITLKSQMI